MENYICTIEILLKNHEDFLKKSFISAKLLKTFEEYNLWYGYQKNTFQIGFREDNLKKIILPLISILNIFYKNSTSKQKIDDLLKKAAASPEGIYINLNIESEIILINIKESGIEKKYIYLTSLINQLKNSLKKEIYLMEDSLPMKNIVYSNFSNACH